MDIVRFVNPDMLWLSALIVPMVAYYVYRMRQGGATMRISTIDGVRRVPRTAKYYLRHLPLVLCCLAVALLSDVYKRQSLYNVPRFVRAGVAGSGRGPPAPGGAPGSEAANFGQHINDNIE